MKSKLEIKGQYMNKMKEMNVSIATFSILLLFYIPATVTLKGNKDYS